MTYTSVGVDYHHLDIFKKMAQLAGRETASNLRRLGFSEVEWSRGESCYLIDIGDAYLGHVEEGLGTKNLVADIFYELCDMAKTIETLTNKSYYDHIAEDTVAMIINDMITLGVTPLSVAMHLAVNKSEWFENEKRCRDLIEGWKKACVIARATWGCGETPILHGNIMPEKIILSGSAMGIIKPKDRLINSQNIQQGDVIIFVESSGIHANGLTMARKIAEKLPEGYLTQLPNGSTYGETLLKPTKIYAPLIEECLNAGVHIHYAVHITGHGWRKLMRATQPFAYIIESLPSPQLIFEFLQKHGPVSDEEAYATFNMGTGFALYVPEKDIKKVEEVCKYSFDEFLPGGFYTKSNYFDIVCAGHIEKSKERKVVIKPKNLEYASATLDIR